jgi:structural maintenance of chromosome 2
MQVDAALDLSHTQNIGHMIRTYFPNAQFIIVSLKEGMFDNANVIFRTRFVDGTSTVRRTAHTAGAGGAARGGAGGPSAKRGRIAAVSAEEQENTAA